MQWAARSAPQSRRRPRSARDDQLRADAVGRGREQPLRIERVQARERAESLRARRLDGGSETVDDRPCRRERDAGGAVAVRRNHQAGKSTARVGPTRGSQANRSATSSGPAFRAARQEPDERLADLDVAACHLGFEQVAEGGRLHLGLVGAQVQLAQAAARPDARADPRSSRAADGPRGGSPHSSRRTCASRRAPGSAGSTAPPARARPGTRLRPARRRRDRLVESPSGPGCRTTLTAPRSSSESRSLNPSRSSCSHETPGSTETWSSPTRP